MLWENGSGKAWGCSSTDKYSEYFHNANSVLRNKEYSWTECMLNSGSKIFNYNAIPFVEAVNMQGGSVSCFNSGKLNTKTTSYSVICNEKQGAARVETVSCGVNMLITWTTSGSFTAYMTCYKWRIGWVEWG